MTRQHHEPQRLGLLNDRELRHLPPVRGTRLPLEPHGLLRLHMELYEESDCPETADAMRRYGGVCFGDMTSRDMVVPSDMPLYALHYAIQRAFGWRNSHLHHFLVPDERIRSLTADRLSVWADLAGIIFRTPMMSEFAEFWADDYERGSVPKWLRSKYTGPYLSKNWEEGLPASRASLEGVLEPDRTYYLFYVRPDGQDAGQPEEEERPRWIAPVLDREGRRTPPELPSIFGEPSRIEEVRQADLPACQVRQMFDRDAFSLVERLPVSSVLLAGKDALPECCGGVERQQFERRLSETGPELLQKHSDAIARLLAKGSNLPADQIDLEPFTDVLLYEYDFGDDWKIRITASWNCPDLVQSGRVTQEELDAANLRCRLLYAPVLLARDGEMLVDDAGGMSGLTDFFRTLFINLKDVPDDELEELLQRREEVRAWARSMGWRRARGECLDWL